MRYSNQAPATTRELVAASATNPDFFRAARRSAGDEALAGAILLIGASDERALSLRRAQAVLRYDRLSSYWSHAALLIGADGDDVRGVEVTLDPPEVPAQRASRNGATVFSLARYEDAARYPNLGLFCFGFPKKSKAREAIVQAALDPNRERTRYPLWDQLGTWARYAYAPDASPNPLLEGIAVPSAAYCEYAFGAASIDLTPGATGNHACPEVLWATMKRWSSALEAMQSVTIQSFTLLRDPTGAPLPPLPSLAEELGGPPERGSGGPSAKRRPERNSNRKPTRRKA